MRAIFDLPGKRERLKELEEKLAASDLWADPERAKALMKERGEVAATVERLERLRGQLSEAQGLVELAEEEADTSILPEIRALVSEARGQIEQLERMRLLSGPDDHRGAILTINSGAGGTDAQDWAQMLLRLYTRYGERQGFKVRLLDMQEGEEAGIKSATLEIDGEGAYGLLKGESGIHRLVRISPFDASRRRHTAFASVLVMPLVEEDIKIEINEKDLRIDTFRASGAGGQHVNKTSSAVRITHLPTGVVVQCQNEKSQHRNKEIAMRILRARLYELELNKRRQQKRELHESLADIAWGSQIRSYVLAPYRLVKDHRTGVEKGDVDAVLDGEIEEFIEGYLLWSAANGQQAAQA